MCDISERCGLSSQEYSSDHGPGLIGRLIFLRDPLIMGYYPNEKQSN